MVQHPLIVVMLLFTLSACHLGKKVKIFFLVYNYLLLNQLAIGICPFLELNQLATVMDTTF